MAQTINGVIARENYDKDFLSDITGKYLLNQLKKLVVSLQEEKHMKKLKNGKTIISIM